jgi:hypothetical protein
LPRSSRPLAAFNELEVTQMDPEYDRRRFLGRATIGLAGVTAAILAVPALANLGAPAVEDGSFNGIDLGKTSLYPIDHENPWRVVTFAGPPVRPLNRYETRVDRRGHLILGRLDAVDFQLRRHPLAPPGVPVSGLLAPLYPSPSASQ